MTHKTCPKCDQDKDLEEFCIARHNKDGRHRWCRDCCKANFKRLRELYRSRTKEPVQTKLCPSCELTKETRYFGRDMNRKDGLAHSCLACLRKNNNERRAANREKRREKGRAYYKTHAENLRNKSRRWKEVNPDRACYFGHKNLAKRRRLTWMLDEDWFLTHIWEQKCSYGDHPAKGGIDRIDSSRGYEPDNCVPCCRRCNMIKGEWTVEEMYINLEEMLQYHKVKLTAQGG
jgi:hypothetical protein